MEEQRLELLGVRRVSELLGLPQRTVFRLLAEDLPSVKIRSRRYVRRADLERFLKEQQQRPDLADSTKGRKS